MFYLLSDSGIVGRVSNFSYRVQREVMPLYVMGSSRPDPVLTPDRHAVAIVLNGHVPIWRSDCAGLTLVGGTDIPVYLDLTGFSTVSSDSSSTTLIGSKIIFGTRSEYGFAMALVDHYLRENS
jgi:hypothetical protein